MNLGRHTQARLFLSALARPKTEIYLKLTLLSASEVLEPWEKHFYLSRYAAQAYVIIVLLSSVVGVRQNLVITGMTK